MDELTLLRNTRENSPEPSANALTAGRTVLMARIASSQAALGPRRPARSRLVPRVTWASAGLAAAVTGVLVAGNVTMGAQAAFASDVLQTAASETIEYANLTAGSGQYLRALTHARWLICDEQGCEPNKQILDVYMPADPNAEWVLYRDWGPASGFVETLRAVNGRFYDSVHSWVDVDYTEIPLDGADAYAWIDVQYNGGSSSRDEDNFVRIADILRRGLVPAPQRAALLDALARIPGVTATDGVENLEGVAGVAIGRTEVLRAGERHEIILDPETGLIIGERVVSGAAIFGWGAFEEITLTAVETSVVDEAP